MVSKFYSERYRHWIFRGRLTLALVGRRAEECPNRRCARKRRCLGLRKGAYFEKRGCSLMNPVEWEMVRRGCSAVTESLRPWFLAQDRKEEEFLKTLPKAKRQQVLEVLRAEQAQLEASRPPWKPYLFDILWMEPTAEDGLHVPDDAAAEEKKLIAEAIAIGCRCVKEGMQVDCERCEGR